MTSGSSCTLILPFTSKTGQSAAQKKTKDFLIWVLLVKREHILAFYRSNFRLSSISSKGTRDRTKPTGTFAFFHPFLSRHPRHRFSASPIFTVTFLGTTETLVTSPAGWTSRETNRFID